jgi:hypothetical protein
MATKNAISARKLRRASERKYSRLMLRNDGRELPVEPP